MFLSRGFDAVSVAEVAAAVEVSTMTVFHYFPTKEDLVLHRVEDHCDDAATTVRARRPGETPLAALRCAATSWLASARGKRSPASTTGRSTSLSSEWFSTPLACDCARWSRAGGRKTQCGIRRDHRGRGRGHHAADCGEPGDRRPADPDGTQSAQCAGGRYCDAVAAANRAFDLLEHGLGSSGLAV
ncbi:TetR/AcrR family transcriptional regulator [Streptomyces platensis]|uniref:TetR/AcrR family transcriptional regulator n=1 Tax=Streptomyces platensis TaxID=58346 RepID=UPI003C307542